MPAGSGHAQVLEWISAPLDLIMIGILVTMSALRQQAGSVLLDLGRINSDRSFLVFLFGGFWLVNGVFQEFNRHSLYGIACLLLGAALFLTGAQHLLVCEKGILATGFWGLRLLRWDNIVAYSIQPRGTLTVELRGKGWISRGLRIPLDRCEQLDAFLAARYPKVESPLQLFNAQI